jgi:hypothetical protein
MEDVGWPFGQVSGYSVYFMAIYYVYLVVIWYIPPPHPHFGMLYQEKSGSHV